LGDKVKSHTALATQAFGLTPTQRTNGDSNQAVSEVNSSVAMGVNQLQLPFVLSFGAPGNNGEADDVDHEFDRKSSLADSQ
jgi:hypothetical protein